MVRVSVSVSVRVNDRIWYAFLPIISLDKNELTTQIQNQMGGVRENWF